MGYLILFVFILLLILIVRLIDTYVLLIYLKKDKELKQVQSDAEKDYLFIKGLY